MLKRPLPTGLSLRPTILFWFFLALLLAVVACSVRLPGSSTELESASSEEVASEADDELDPPPLRAASLSPVIREVGSRNSGPAKLVVEFARPVVEASALGPPGGRTELVIEPAVAGELLFTGPSTLTFTPEGGFAPETRYEVELAALETPDGAVVRPRSGAWKRVFETPAFSLVRGSLSSLDFAARRAVIELHFSAPVDPEAVAEAVALSVEDRTFEPTAASPSADPRAVSLELRGEGIEAGGILRVRIASGLRSTLGGEPAGPHRARIVFEPGPIAEVLSAERKEGENGFFVDIVCHDGAAEGRRWYWDRRARKSREISTRCRLAESSWASLHFEPEVDFTVSPSSGGFRIFGDFERGTYRLRLDGGARTADGGVFRQAWQEEIQIPARSPLLRFLGKGRYLPRRAWNDIPFRYRNVERATLSVRHVPPENLVFWMSGTSEATTDRDSNLVTKSRIPLGGEVDTELDTSLDVASLLPATRGLLEVRLHGSGASDIARLILTDLHLVAKREGHQGAIRVWALDHHTLQPAEGTEVSLVRKSGFVLDRCRTVGDQGCRLEPDSSGPDSTDPFALVARRGEDLTYLAFDELETEVQEARISGDAYRGAARYRAAIHSDRGVYRPGEVVHLAAVVRAEDDAAPPGGMPVEGIVTDPRGRTVERRNLETNDAGWVALDIDLPSFATTGRYRLRLEAARRSLGEHDFLVEEFVPERMKVDVAAADELLAPGELPALEVRSRYLFGGVPAGHRLELRCELAPGDFSPAAYPNFTFGLWRDESEAATVTELGLREAFLDDEGAARVECADATGGALRGPSTLRASAAVFESGSGRTTVGRAEVPVHPERFYLGLATGAEEAEAGREVSVEGVVVDWDGRPSGEVPEVEVQVFRLETEWGLFWDEAEGREIYRHHRRPVLESRQAVPVRDGKFLTVFTPTQGGNGYLVRAEADAARSDLYLEGSGSYWWWGPYDSDVDQTPRPDRPTWIELRTPEMVRVGEPFPVTFEAPYAGRVLLTTETDEILQSHWLDVAAGEVVWMAKIEEFVPNVYLGAFLVKDPHLESDEAFLPDRAFGVQSVTVEPADYVQALTLEAPVEVRSGQSFEVTLDLGRVGSGDGPRFATVAAVDQGILSLTRFETPDPLAAIFQRRALGVKTFETVGWTLLLPPAGPGSVTGGGALQLLDRVQGVEPVALWSGLVEVPKNGRVVVPFELPTYRGELRVMAVAAGANPTGERRGHGQGAGSAHRPGHGAAVLGVGRRSRDSGPRHQPDGGPAHRRSVARLEGPRSRWSSARERRRGGGRDRRTAKEDPRARCGRRRNRALSGSGHRGGGCGRARGARPLGRARVDGTVRRAAPPGGAPQPLDPAPGGAGRRAGPLASSRGLGAALGADDRPGQP